MVKTADDLDVEAAALYEQIRDAANEKDTYLMQHRDSQTVRNAERDQLLGEAAALRLVEEMPAAEQQAVAAALAKAGG